MKNTFANAIRGTLILGCLVLFSFTTARAQLKQATHASVSLSCNTELADRDHENAVLTFNQANQELNGSIDLNDVLENNTSPDTDVESMPDMVPLSFFARLSIPDLDFKAAANNGESYVFDTKITLNGITRSMPCRYVLLYAPKVSDSMNGAPLCSFRIDLVFSIQPSDFNLAGVLNENCNEIIVAVQDGLLNRVTN